MVRGQTSTPGAVAGATAAADLPAATVRLSRYSPDVMIRVDTRWRARDIRRIAATLLTVTTVVLAAPTTALGTWSIVAVDAATREVGSAGASCTGFVAGILDLAPGKGVIAAQAQSNMAAKRRGKQLLAEGMTPARVLAAVANPDFDREWQKQQYGVASLNGQPAAAAFTGADTPESRGDRQGPGFSVQGNILGTPDVIARTFAAFTEAERARATLAERLLAALEAGAAAGGDRRCGTQTATSAYLVVAKPADTAERPFLSVVVPGQPRGGANAVTVLRRMFEQRKSAAPKQR